MYVDVMLINMVQNIYFVLQLLKITNFFLHAHQIPENIIIRVRRESSGQRDGASLLQDWE